MRARSSKLLSGASAIAVVAALGVIAPANAGQTVTGPLPADAIVNTQVDFVTINGNATVYADANGDSFYNGLNMNAPTDALQVDSSYLAGAITNVAQMLAANNAIAIQANSQVDGGFENSGTLSGGQYGFVIDGDSSLDNGFLNNGSITGGVAGVYLGLNSDINGGLTNNVLISGAIGINMAGDSFELRGGIDNNAGAVIIGTTTAAIQVNGANTQLKGGITNDGTIRGQNSANGIQMFAGTIAGGITNNTGAIIDVTGTSATAILISGATFNGNITNSGQILGENTSSFGIVINGATAFTGNIANNASGVIGGDATAVAVGGASFTGNVVNDGAIRARTGAGVLVNATAFTGNVTNNARITSVSGDGVVVAGPITGTIANAGTIIGGSDGVSIGGAVSGGIVTSGTIIGETGVGIDVTGATVATITQTAGLIRGGDGVTVGTALNLANGSTFNGDGGTLDGDVTAGGTDDFVMHASGTFSYLRGTATGLDQFDMQGTGTAVLGAASRGANGAGVTVNAASMTHSGTGTVYIDDDTVVNLTTYTQTAGTLEFQLTSNTAAGNYGTIAAGTANLGGNIAAYIQGDTFASVGGNTFTYQDVIVGATAGTFTNAGTIATNSIFFTGSALVNAGDVDIILNRQGFSTALALTSLSQNQTTIGNTLETIYNAGGYSPEFTALFNYLLSIPAGDEEEVARVYDDISGSEHASLQEAGLRVSQGFNDAVGGRLDDLRGPTGNARSAELALRRYADAAPAANTATDAMDRPSGAMRGSMSIWGRGYGAWTTSDGDAEAAGYDQDTGGFAGGLDFAVDNRWNVGGAIGWSTTDVEFNTLRDSADIDTFQFAGYGAYTGQSFYADAQIGVGFHDLSATRFIDVTANPPVVASSNYDANAFGVRTEAGVIFDSGRIDFTPFLGLAYASTSTDGFVESGAGAFNLLVAESDADSLTTTLGMRFSGAWQAGGVRLVPVAEIAWRHEFLDDNQSFGAAFLEDPATQFQIVSAEQVRDTIVANLGLGAQVSKSVTLFVDYNGLYSSSFNTHAASAGLRATW